MVARLGKIALTFLAVPAFVTLSGIVLAQPQTQPAPATQPAGPTDHTPLGSDIDVPMKARANISVADMTQQSTTYIGRMNEDVKRMVQLQELARREKDVIKLNCVNDKLLQLKQLQNIADQANNNMQEAIARGDEESRYHEFGRITISAQQAQALTTDARNCIGEDLAFLGPTQVTVEEPTTPEDVTVPEPPTLPVVQPLPVASPTM
jgi:hypothetical protein